MTTPSSDPGAKTGRDPKGAALDSPSLEPGLYVVATPIGNLRDITLRALDILGGADRIYAEDKRVTRKLLDAFAIPTPLSSYHEHNAEAARAEILDALGLGARIALVSDAGTPLVSDPGFKLVRAATEAGFKIIPAPGASAVLAALVGAALPSDRFLFAGFAPPKTGARRAMFEELREARATLILFESGPRLADSLADMAAVFGPRPAVVARELTKLYEEFRRAPLDQLAAHYQSAPTPKGEIVLLIGPPAPAPAVTEATLDAFLIDALAHVGIKEAASLAAERLGVPRRTAYNRAVTLKHRA